MGSAGDDDAPGEKTLLRSEALYQYILNTSVFPREHECLRELRLVTEKHPRGFMGASPDETQFLTVLLKATKAKNTIEIGVFTGSSLLATALALPDDGKVVAMDISREYYNVGLPMIEKAGVAHKIHFHEGPALDFLDELLSEEENLGKFDFAFVDADKSNYLNYHERLLKLVRVGGIIGYDNTLWGGLVAMPPGAATKFHNPNVTETIKSLNSALAADGRVLVSQLSIADGLTLCFRLI